MPSEPESIVSVKLKNVEDKKKKGKADDGWWQSWIFSWDLLNFIFLNLLELFFDFLRTLGQLEPLPDAEAYCEEEDGADGVDVAEAGEDNVSQLLHHTFQRILIFLVFTVIFYSQFSHLLFFYDLLKDGHTKLKEQGGSQGRHGKFER